MKPEAAQSTCLLKTSFLFLWLSIVFDSGHPHLGSFLSFQVLGCGSVAQAILSRGHLGGIVTINVGFAMAVVMAIYVTGGVSGK